MRIVNDALLQQFRMAPRCECGCGRTNRDGQDAHHVFLKRGLGGGTRLDASINLASVNRWCHSAIESSIPRDESMRQIVAQREKSTVAAIEETLRFLLRCPKGASAEWIRTAAQPLTDEVRRLVEKCLVEMPGEPIGGAS